MTISAEVSERALREIHLVAFEAAVREAGVWSVMTAYNKVNGIYCGEQPDLIDGVLRDEWGFDGLVMSDWFGTHSTVPAVRAGLGPRDARPARPGSAPPWRRPCATAWSTSPWWTSRCATCCGLMDRVGVLDGRGGVRSRNRKRTIPGGGPWPGRWRPRERSCWSTTGCSR